mgnify:CR=1 FL=1
MFVHNPTYSLIHYVNLITLDLTDGSPWHIHLCYYSHVETEQREEEVKKQSKERKTLETEQREKNIRNKSKEVIKKTEIKRKS